MHVLVFVIAGRGWPIAAGAGFGLGMAFSECQYDFAHAQYLHGKVCFRLLRDLLIELLFSILTAQL